MRRFLLSLVLSVLCASTASAELFFSEYVEGSGNNKALEIYNPGPGSVNVANYQIRMYFNGSSSAGTTVSLAGNVPAGGTYVVVQNAATDPLLISKANAFSSASWFNGDDAVALVKNPGAVVVDVIGQIGFDPGTQWGSGLTSTEDNTMRRKFEVCGGDANGGNVFIPADEWIGFAQNDFTGLGAHLATDDCEDPDPPVTIRKIHEIQGSGAASPFAGQVVQTLDNVVTAVGPEGFFMQMPDFLADLNASTSNGIYVFTSTPPAVAVGDQVDVKGTVVEFFNMTEFTNSGLVVTKDNVTMPLPAYVTLTPGNSNFEPLEGMLVRVTNGAAADGTDQFGETMIVAASSRPFRIPGIGGNAHPEILDVDPTGLGGAAPSIIGGASINLAEGPLAFDFGDYSIWTTTLSYTNPAYPRGARARNAGEMTVAAQNVFRLFDDNDDPSLGEPVPTTAVYNARLAAFSSLVRTSLGSPDVLAVSEVEDQATLADLAARINADEAGLNYVAYVLEGNDIGGIDVGFLVRDTVTVDSVEQLGADDTWIDPQTNAPATLNDRPPLLLRGSYINNGAPFPVAVVAVHQRSLIDVETSARVRAKREAQAENLAGHLNVLQTGEPGVRIVVTGDFNAFEFNDGYVDVMGILTADANLTNQVLSVTAAERYSYVEEGVAQVLDHSLTSAALNPFVREMRFAHANADAPVSAGAPTDHDGVVLYVMTDHDGDGLADDNDDCPTGDARATVIIGDCDSGAPNLAFAGGCTLADQIAAIAESSKNHGQFVSSVGKLLNDLKKDGLLTGAQKGAIEACVAQSNN